MTQGHNFIFLKHLSDLEPYSSINLLAREKSERQEQVYLESGIRSCLPQHTDHAFANPFAIEDLLAFDRKNLGRVLHLAKVTPEHLAWSLHEAPPRLVQEVLSCLTATERSRVSRELSCPLTKESIVLARHLLLDKLFWELVYWKIPEMYEELISGEQIHPGIFQQLEPRLRGKIVLDVGAGSGRASFEAIQRGTRLVYAIEPSPGLRRLLAKKVTSSRAASIIPGEGDFAHLPLGDQSVDIAMACSAFTSESEQGGEAGLAELRRVTRKGGSIVLIWPRMEDRVWLAEHQFHYVALPQEEEMSLSFANWQSAWRCVQLFYAQKSNVQTYLHHAHQPSLPFSVLGSNPPCDYCWLQVS